MDSLQIIMMFIKKPHTYWYTTGSPESHRLFGEEEKQGSGRMTFLHKKVEAKLTLLRRGRDDRIQPLRVLTARLPKCFAFRYQPSHLFAKNDYQSFYLRKNLLKLQILSFSIKKRGYPLGTLSFWSG